MAGVAEVDHLRARVPGLAARVAPLDRHAAADEAVELPVVLDQRAGEVDARELLDRLLARRFRQVRIQARQRRAQVAHQHHVALGRPAQRALRPEGLGVVGVDALPAEPVAQVVGEGLLDQPVFAVDVGDHRQLSEPICDTAHDRECTLEVERIELLARRTGRSCASSCCRSSSSRSGETSHRTGARHGELGSQEPYELRASDIEPRGAHRVVDVEEVANGHLPPRQRRAELLGHRLGVRQAARPERVRAGPAAAPSGAAPCSPGLASVWSAVGSRRPTSIWIVSVLSARSER